MEIQLKLYGSSKILSDKDTLNIQLPNNSDIKKLRDILTKIISEKHLKTPLRKSENNQLLKDTIYEAISRKPKGHDFFIERKENEKFVPRYMNVTGG